VKKCLVVVALVAAACSPPVAAPAVTGTEIPIAMPLSTETEATEPTETAELSPPELSPIGDQAIVFSSDATGDDEIYVVNIDGSELLQVTHLPGTDDFFPQWSPSGKMISFISRVTIAGSYYETFVIMDTEGARIGSIELPSCDRVGLPFWSPDGNWVTLFCEPFAVFFSPDGSVVHKVGEVYRSSSSLMHWSPDSQCLGMEGYSFLVFCLEGTRTEIDAHAIAGRTATDASHGFAWSPGGDKIAYIQHDRQFAEDQTLDDSPWYVMVINHDGTENRRISPLETEVGFAYPEWISSDTILVGGILLDTPNWKRSLFGINVDSGAIRDFTPQFDIKNYVLSPSKQKIAFWSEGSLWLLDIASNCITHITNVASSGFYDIYWAKDEENLLFVGTADYSLINLSRNERIPVDLDPEGGIDLR